MNGGRRLGGAMFGAPARYGGQRDRRPMGGGIPAGWSFLQGRMGGGTMRLPPGVTVPMGNDVRRPPVTGAPVRPPTGGPQTVQPVQPGLQRPPMPLPGPLGAAMGAATMPTPPAAPAPAGAGIPPGMPPPDAGAPQRPTGGPLQAAMLAPTASPQDYLRRSGYPVR